MFLILRSYKKSGFGTDSPSQEAPTSPNPDYTTELFRSPETQGELQAQTAERLLLESTRAVYEKNLGTSTEAYEGLQLGQGNSAILTDLEGAVNQRNYPMVGKDQGALDYTSGPSMKVDPANVMPVNVNILPYPIEGYNLLPEFVGESDIEGAETPLLDLYVPNVPRVSPMMPPPSLLTTSSPMMPSSPLLPTSSPMMLPLSPMMPSPLITPDMAGPERPVVGFPSRVVEPV